MSSGSDIIVLMLIFSIMSSISSVIAGAGLYLTYPEEGAECEGSDVDGVYFIQDGKCELDSCEPGYYKLRDKCMVDEGPSLESGYMSPGTVTGEAEIADKVGEMITDTGEMIANAIDP